jgi:hypothetical protein
LIGTSGAAIANLDQSVTLKVVVLRGQLHMDLVQKIIETATPFVVVLFWSLAVLVAIAASTQSVLGKKFIEFVANIDTSPEYTSTSSAQFKTQTSTLPLGRPK